MPWDGTELWVADFAEDGTSATPRRSRAAPRVDLPARVVARRHAALRLRPHRLVEPLPRRGRTAGRVNLCPSCEAEFGVPQWVFGMSTYAFESTRRIVCVYIERRRVAPGAPRHANRQARARRCALHDFALRRGGRRTRACSPASSHQLRLCSSSRRPAERRSRGAAQPSEVEVDPGYISVPERDRVPHRGRPDRPRLLLPAAATATSSRPPARSRRCSS